MDIYNLLLFARKIDVRPHNETLTHLSRSEYNVRAQLSVTHFIRRGVEALHRTEQVQPDVLHVGATYMATNSAPTCAWTAFTFTSGILRPVSARF